MTPAFQLYFDSAELLQPYRDNNYQYEFRPGFDSLITSDHNHLEIKVKGPEGHSAGILSIRFFDDYARCDWSKPGTDGKENESVGVRYSAIEALSKRRAAERRRGETSGAGK